MQTNLLPPQIKAELREEEIKKLIMILGILILIFLFLLTFILFSIQRYITNSLNLERDILNSQKQNFEVAEIRDLREKIISVNKTLSQLDYFYQKKVSLSELFNKSSAICPSQIYLTNFSFQNDGGQISLSGFSPNRETLFEFKNSLEKEFTEVNFPPQNWIKATDIDFQVNFKNK